MNIVHGLNDEIQIKMIYEALRVRHEKYGILFFMGIETGYRISDLLRIRVKDILGRNFLVLVETKTKKERIVPISSKLEQMVIEYVARHKLRASDYLIFSRDFMKSKALSRVQAYRVFRCVSTKVQKIGTHSMRKTYALRQFRKHGDIDKIRRDLNHTHIDTTLRYLFDFSELSSVFKRLI